MNAHKLDEFGSDVLMDFLESGEPFMVVPDAQNFEDVVEEAKRFGLSDDIVNVEEL